MRAFIFWPVIGDGKRISQEKYSECGMLPRQCFFKEAVHIWVIFLSLYVI